MLRSMRTRGAQTAALIGLYLLAILGAATVFGMALALAVL